MVRTSHAFFIGTTIVVAVAWLYYGYVTLKQDSFSVQERVMEDNSIGPEKLILSEDEWKERLTPEQYRILREKGTEPAFSSKFTNVKVKGTYHCAACNLPLFSSEAKYDSGTGWPSFKEPIRALNLQYEEDNSFLTKKVGLLCGRCNSHLGHVFEDGPPPKGLRYCINSLALKFIPSKGGDKR